MMRLRKLESICNPAPVRRIHTFIFFHGEPVKHTVSDGSRGEPGPDDMVINVRFVASDGNGRPLQCEV